MDEKRVGTGALRTNSLYHPKVTTPESSSSGLQDWVVCRFSTWVWSARDDDDAPRSSAGRPGLLRLRQHSTSTGKSARTCSGCGLAASACRKPCSLLARRCMNLICVPACASVPSVVSRRSSAPAPLPPKEGRRPQTAGRRAEAPACRPPFSSAGVPRARRPAGALPAALARRPTSTRTRLLLLPPYPCTTLALGQANALSRNLIQSPP